MFNQDEFSDTTVIIQNIPLPAHQLIISLQSPYLANAIQEAFVSTGARTIVFDEGSGTAHWRVFEYLYSGDYSDNLSIKDLTDPESTQDVRVYALATKYGLEDLKSLAMRKLQQTLKDNWRSDSFAECAREAYALTDKDDAIRSAVVKIAAAHVHDLAHAASFTSLVREGGDFVHDYLDELHQRPLLTPFGFGINHG
ncbi:hypothetical protein GQ44DRAFT_403148 [Phaeosphaeriaceae sp. PMI808]|nr:hypothetical protein GQ44DRAFT_403148 [Phaeosphaeriaceae sp. PMI808]